MIATWLATRAEAEELAQRVVQGERFWRAWPCERRDDRDGALLGYGATVEYVTGERWVIASWAGFQWLQAYTR